MLCGVDDGGVRVRDGLSFSILKVDDEKEKGDAYRGSSDVRKGGRNHVLSLVPSWNNFVANLLRQSSPSRT